MTFDQIEDRIADIKDELEKEDADVFALDAEYRSLDKKRTELIAGNEQRRKLLESLANGNEPVTVLRSFRDDGIQNPFTASAFNPFAYPTPAPTMQYTREQLAQKVVFRSGENVSDKYDTANIDVEKCLRSAITGNRNDLNEAEQRALTPDNTGAILDVE